MPLTETREDSGVFFFDRNGILLAENLSPEEKRKIPISLSSVAPEFLQAVIAVEDQNFWNHRGIDMLATFRAAHDNIITGRVVSGASTLSQQLARNRLGARERNLWNKLHETFLAFRLETQFPKAEILEQWINSVSFGGNIVGVEAASQAFFQKSARHIDLAEAAFLAGIPQSPERFHPVRSFPAAKDRQEFVLRRMQAERFIDSSERLTATEQELFITYAPLQNTIPHFSRLLTDSRVVQNLFQQNTSQIFTTIEGSLQEKIEDLVTIHLSRLESHNIQNAAVLAWERSSGDVIAYIGNSDFSATEKNGEVDILRSKRAVGSTLKPFLYLLAFQKLGWTPNTLIADEPTGFGTSTGFLYEPQNYDLSFRGEISITTALAESRNVPAVKTLELVGISDFLEFLQSFGIPTDDVRKQDFGLSTALGSFDIAPLDLAQAYGVLASGNKDFAFRFLAQDSVFRIEKPSLPHNLDCDTAFSLINILDDDTARINAFGSHNTLEFPFAVAAKTGTTRNFRDNWAVGFSSEIGVLVWVGNADGTPMRSVSGITGAGPLFQATLKAAMQNRPQQKQFSTDMICPESAVNNASIISSSEQLPESNTAPLSPKILFPLSGHRFTLSLERPLSLQKIELQANMKVEWKINGSFLGTGEKIWWIPERGNNQIHITNEAGATDTIHIRVE